MTGMSPAHHGLFEFFRREPGSYRQTLNSHLSLDGKTLWRILSDAGKQVGVIGVPLTYPPESVSGFLITGLLTPAHRSDFTYPPSLLTELETHLGEYRLRHDVKYRRGRPEPLLKEQYEILENNIQAALYLMQERSWDFCMVHLLGTDRIQHELWHLLDPSHPQHDSSEREKYGNVVLDFYKEVDAGIGRLLSVLDDDDVVLVMSDHGLGPVHKFINVNTWLLRQGYLRLKPSISTALRRLLFHLGVNYRSAALSVLQLGMGKQFKEIGRARRENLQRRFFLSLDDVDWDRSRAYSMGNFGQIFVNLRGREPNGIVSPGDEYERLLEDLSTRLTGIVDPETGEAIIENVFRREEVHHGPHAAEAPDLMFFTREMKYKAMGLSDFSSPRVVDPIYGTTGHHRMNGVMIWRGHGLVQKGKQLEGARIQDLAPTILYAMGVPVPMSMDGDVLSDVFTVDFRQSHRIEYSDADSTAARETDSAYTEEEQAELRGMLRGLGYVD